MEFIDFKITYTQPIHHIDIEHFISYILTTMKSVNSHTHKKSVEKGLTIYKTGRSKFWQARLWDRRNDKYASKSTGVVNRQEATIAARNWKDTYIQKASSHLVSLATFKDAFEYFARIIPITSKDDWVILKHPNDGILAYFGNFNVKSITTGTIRNYLRELDSNRPNPLATSTLKKHVIILRKVLRFAREDGRISSIPDSPKLKSGKVSPRPGFDGKEFLKFYTHLLKQRDAGHLTVEFVAITVFIIHTFIRPTVNELMGLRVRDITVINKGEAAYLEIKVTGKTGYRIAVSMKQATKHFHKQVKTKNLNNDDYLWYPNIADRAYAFRKFSLQFNKELKLSGMKHTEDGQSRSAYSLRLFSLTSRLNSSAGKINIFTLAKNAGTSVQMLEQHYIKYLKPSKEVTANLQNIEF